MLLTPVCACVRVCSVSILLFLCPVQAFLDTLQPWLSACPPDVLDKEMGQFIGGMGFQAKLEAFLRLGCTAVDRLCRQRSAACLATLTDLYELSKDSYTALLLPVEGKVPEGIGVRESSACPPCLHPF